MSTRYSSGPRGAIRHHLKSYVQLRIYLIIIPILLLTGCFYQPNPPALDNGVNSVDNQVIIPEVIPEVTPEIVIEQPEDRDIYYLGYGSNMSLTRMNDRCGTDNFIDLGWASLADYRFYFFARGYANIKADADSQVEGVLYKINKNCLQALDIVEGYPSFYQRLAVPVSYQGQSILTQVYIDIDDVTTGQPTDSYYDVVIIGAQEHNLPADYIDFIKETAGR